MWKNNKKNSIDVYHNYFDYEFHMTSFFMVEMLVQGQHLSTHGWGVRRWLICRHLHRVLSSQVLETHSVGSFCLWVHYSIWRKQHKRYRNEMEILDNVLNSKSRQGYAAMDRNSLWSWNKDHANTSATNNLEGDCPLLNSRSGSSCVYLHKSVPLNICITESRRAIMFVGQLAGIRGAGIICRGVATDTSALLSEITPYSCLGKKLQ